LAIAPQQQFPATGEDSVNQYTQKPTHGGMHCVPCQLVSP